MLKLLAIASEIVDKAEVSSALEVTVTLYSHGAPEEIVLEDEAISHGQEQQEQGHHG